MTKSFPHRPRHVRGQARLARRVQIFKKRLGRLSALRLALFVGGVGLPLALLQAGGSGTVVLSGAPLFVAFGFVFYFYGRLQRKLRLAEGQLANYAEDQARGEPGWWNRLPASDAPPGIADDHPYSDDLSLFGRFSVFQHFDRTATPVGRARLVELLTSQPDAVALDASAHAARTDGIRFLARRSVFRQRWRREGRPLAETYRRLFDLSWIAGIQNLPDARMPRVLVWIAYILPAITLGTYIGFEMQWTRAYFLLTLPVQFVLFFILHFRHHHLAGTHAKIVDQLSGLDALFRVAAGLGGMNQSEPAAGLDRQPHLRALSVTASGPAREIRLLSSLAGYFSFRRNPLLHGLAGIFFLYEAHVVFALGAWQRRCRADFARWFVDLAELDALLACACVGDTEPDCCFAENLDHSDDSESALCVEARNLSHPLIARAERVANDVTIQTGQKLWLITGSNMSGKSTFLRTIGTALVFAMIGAPVIASRFRFRPLRIMTSMNQRDDLSRSLSLFYAEVKRIKQLQTASEADHPRALCLVDEMLRGTNARERLIASSAILEHLRESPALALVATHDLDLIELTRKHDDVVCYHFQEIIDETAGAGQTMSFDYRLKEGPVTSSNALKILELEGVRL